MTSYTNARPGAGLLVVDLDLRPQDSSRQGTDGSRHAVSKRQAVRLRRADERETGSGGPVKAVLKL